DHAIPPGDGPGVARPSAHAQERSGDSGTERLNRFLARAGVASRRAADQLISSGSVRVNGKRPPATGLEIDPDQDTVTADGGLLLLTDDGDVAYRLTHPRYKVDKEYVVTVAGVPRSNELKALREGVKLDDGMTAPAEVEMMRATTGARDSGRAELRVVIREGRQRQVRRMVEAIGHKVLGLRRTSFGPLRLGRLKTGGWRVLSSGEVIALRRATGLDVT